MLSFQTDRRLSEFSTFGIGGPISLFFEARTKEAMIEALSLSKLPVLVIGKGSNCLFPDEGFPGLVILNRIDTISWGDRSVTVGAGYSFALLGVQTARRGWSGLEFASGIPASVGGAIYMNAGASGGDTFGCLDSVDYLSFNGENRLFQKEELRSSYRHSMFQEMQGAILEATFLLSPKETARTDQLKIVDYRLKTQPYKEKSAGCVFRNPPGRSAGALIEQCGLKGCRVGDAVVSEMHANFIVNRGEATASEVKELIGQVQRRVKEQTGIDLEPEIRLV
jgi:UDP-N-acetylmuramate dehydrogenase